VVPLPGHLRTLHIVLLLVLARSLLPVLFGEFLEFEEVGVEGRADGLGDGQLLVFVVFPLGGVI